MDDRLEERVAALERTITDGHADDGLPEAARMDARLDELEATVGDIEARVAELDAAVQALRGFAGGVRAVDEAVERRADAAVARVDRLESELAAVREAVSGRDETSVANEPTDRDHATAPPRDARTTSQRDSSRREPSVAGDRSEGAGRVGDRSRDRDGSLTGEVAARTDDALADAAAMEAKPDDADADRSLAERIRRLL
ncbi:DUF7310 family coiled-coil domain-containing protein [Haloplanus rubicundus]|uniref:DUF7310 domain-containing protein n=1 Tax=Haloplanus rubicundus TaxID=1547898 RepID=A0A345ECK5_9EURY|nr:hypothetical protein [Haloplanus rubicundus]AXG09927.1 hypothetical protein DU484_08745 [Haloplanus rubicundus]